MGRLRESSPIFRLWRWCDTKWMRNSDRIVCIAEGMAERIVRTRGISASKVLAIHDGFDPNRVGPDALADSSKPNSFQKEFNPDRKIVVQYAGNMGLSHPFETIMQACARFAADDRVQFQFIGGGPQREYVRANLPKNGVLIDYQPIERLGELLSAADICLISQHEEMFDKALPYKVYGVFAAGKPTVFVGNGQSEIVRWLIESHVGLAVRQGDVDGLRALTRLLDDSEERLEMGKAARALLDRALHAEQAAKQWAELIVELIPEQKSAHQ
ncbi:MAG: glycosyltransferase family 4 protein [Planctomycetes bacterium]|nr:glycosyltransferase family 4 protein [Planctomycetota bacterium]